MKSSTAAIAIAFLVPTASALLAQSTAPPVILTVDLENIVSYVGDAPDISKLALNTSVTPAVTARNFYSTPQRINVQIKPDYRKFRPDNPEITALPSASARNLEIRKWSYNNRTTSSEKGIL